MKLTVGLLTLTGACASAPGVALDRDPAPKCLAATTSDTTVYDTLQVTRRPKRYGGPYPTYPTSAREQGVQGRVVIAMIIEPTGEVNQASVSVVRSPDSRLTESALVVARESKYRPGCLEGRAVRTRVALPVDFTLRW